jgi:hypothetical protein
MKCCDDRLNPPWVARSSRAMTIECVASFSRRIASEVCIFVLSLEN